MAGKVSIAAVVVAGAVGSAGSAAWGADPAVNFAGSGSTFAGDCRCQDANLAGSNNTVTIRGACRAFQVAGDGNRVLVDMAPSGTLRCSATTTRSAGPQAARFRSPRSAPATR